jgi:3-methyladenine DNA glycosylase Tag
MGALPDMYGAEKIRTTSDDRYLAAMARVIMRSGFSWRVVEAKWPGFEVAFVGFDPHAVAMFSDDDLARLVSDTSIIRNGQKIRAIQDNAIMATRIIDDHGSLGAFFAQWPADDFVGLWAYLKKNGNRLGGKSASYFLREVGWDSPILSRDVVLALVREGVVEKEPTSKKALAQMQDAFNSWRVETGLPNAHLSRLLAQSVG